jgi:hypothetical protein
MSRACFAALRGSLVALAVAATVPVFAAEFPPAIEDNSFLLEEAYNQEAGVVQHIATFVHFRSPTSSELGFAQEWPMGGRRHQLSYALPYSWTSGLTGDLGDLALNYRFQLRSADQGVAVAPSLSVIVPIGHGHEGGLQVNLPLSRRVSEHLALHANAGASYLREAAAPAGRSPADLHSVHAGASAIGMVSSTLNVMLEALVTSAEEIGDDGFVARRTATTLAPALRFAINRGTLQIVPGIGAPITFSDGRTDVGVYLYLSFEHPF